MNIKKILMFLYLFLIILVPNSLNVYNITYAKLIFVFTAVLLVYNFFYLIKNKKIYELWIKYKNSFWLYLCVGIFIFTIVVFISTLINSWINKSLLLKDYFEIARGFLYVGLIINMLLLNNDDDVKVFSKKIVILFIVIMCGISIMQFYDIGGLNKLYVKFVAPTQYDNLIIKYKFPRVVGLTSNPNILGCLLVIVLPIFLDNILKIKKINLRMILNIFLYLIARIVIYMTSTRSAFVLALLVDFSYLFFCFYYWLKSKIKKKQNDYFYSFAWLKLMLIIVIEIFLLFTLPRNMTWRVKHMLNFQSMNSWNERVENSENMLDKIFDNNNSSSNNNVNKDDNISVDDNSSIDKDKVIEDSVNDNDSSDDNEFLKNIKLLVGVGPSKDKHTATTGENEWLMILYKYGFLGIAAYLFIYFMPLKSFKTITFNSRILYMAIAAVIFIYMIPGGIYHVYNLYLLILTIMCLYIKEV